MLTAAGMRRRCCRLRHRWRHCPSVAGLLGAANLAQYSAGVMPTVDPELALPKLPALLQRLPQLLATLGGASPGGPEDSLSELAVDCPLEHRR